MKATLYAKPFFQLQLTAQEADAIIEAARHHYDAACRSLIVPGPGACLNMLVQMRKDVGLNDLSHAGYLIPLTHRELDLVCKCVESYTPHHGALQAKLYTELLSVLRNSSAHPLFHNFVHVYEFDREE